jgi:hypothetical protein
MLLPAVAKYALTVLSPGVTLMLFRPLLEDDGRARYCERGVPCIQLVPPPDLLTGSSTAKVDDVPGDRVPIPSTKRPFSR